MNDGGSAFPIPAVMPSTTTTGLGSTTTFYQPAQPGMSMRDYFIAHAPAQEINDIVPSDIKGCAAYIGITAEEYKGSEHYLLVLSKARGQWADAMLKAREQPAAAEGVEGEK